MRSALHTSHRVHQCRMRIKQIIKLLRCSHFRLLLYFSMRRESQMSQNGLKSVQSLQTFKLLPNETAPIYYNAGSLPLFLQNNLRAQHRIIKQIQGDDAVLRGFYFNLMKLAFEIQCEHKDYPYIVKKILLGQQEFGAGELEDKNLRDGQYRKFLAEFIQIIQNQELPSFEQTVQWYPIIDDILLKMFRRLVPVTLKLKDTSDYSIAKRIFQFLSQMFEIKMNIISGCFKFVESDIFLYVDNLKHVFVIFVDQLAFIKEVTQYQSSINSQSKSSSILSQKSNRISKKEHKNQSQNVLCQQEGDTRLSGKGKNRLFNTVINMLDSKFQSTDKSHMTASIKYRNSFDNNNFQNAARPRFDKVKEKESLFQDYYGSQRSKNKIENQISSLSTIKAQQSVSSDKSSILADYKSIEERKSFGSTKQPEKHLFSINIDRQNRMRKNLQQTCIELKGIPKSLDHKPNSIKLSGSIPNNSKEKYIIKRTLDIVIKPQQQNQRQLVSPGNSKNSNLGLFSKINKKGSLSNEPLKIGKKEEDAQKKDSSYEKFTDSGLLEILDEEYKAQIKSIKQKFRDNRTNLKKYI